MRHIISIFYIDRPVPYNFWEVFELRGLIYQLLSTCWVFFFLLGAPNIHVDRQIKHYQIRAVNKWRVMKVISQWTMFRMKVISEWTMFSRENVTKGPLVNLSNRKCQGQSVPCWICQSWTDKIFKIKDKIKKT